MADKIEAYHEEFKKLIDSIVVADRKGKSIPFFSAISEVSQLIENETANKKNKVMFIGNGGSAAIASHMAIDLWKNGGIKALAFNDSSLLTCISNDCGYEQVFEKPVEMFADEGDVLVAISSSGCSENILNAVKAAELKKCSVITMSGFGSDNPLRSMGNFNYYVSSQKYGPVEVAHQYICHFILDIIMGEENG